RVSAALLKSGPRLAIPIVREKSPVRTSSNQLTTARNSPPTSTRFCRDLRATEPVDPAQPVMMADDPQWNNAKKCMQEGIPVGPGLMNQVRQIAQACAAPWLLD